jgi:hypothetical protein
LSAVAKCDIEVAMPNADVSRASPRPLFVYLAVSGLTTLGCSGDNEPISQTQAALLSNAGTNFLMVPAYLASQNNEANWSAAMPTQTNGKMSIFIVTGPNSGPPTAYDPDLVNHITQLQANHALVLGYVSWKNKTASQVKNDIDGWKNPNLQIPWPPGIGGIFIDDAEQPDETNLPQAEWLGTYVANQFPTCMYAPCAGTVVFNWGGVGTEMEKYVNCQLLKGPGSYYHESSMHWVTYEGTEDNYLWATDWRSSARAWTHNFNSFRFANLVYHDWYNGACVTGDCTPNLLQASSAANAGLVYMTDHMGPEPCTSSADCAGGVACIITPPATTGYCNENTWERAATNPLWGNEQSAVSGYANTFDGAAIESETFTYTASQCPDPTL